MKKDVLAVVGASEDTTKYGYKIFETLVQMEEPVYAVNPKGGEILGRKVYADLSSLPEKPDIVIIVIPPLQTRPVVEEAVKLGVREIFFQPGTQNPKSIQLAEDNGIEVTAGCFMMERGYW
ncbi:hypothetical protein Dip518_001609 [Parelusimicrobium proximum]|uniref:CoA-binding protein n=1 Tax=Parelusimicrobium proximum TaxID=3228953 RepID=UPI003D178CC3